MEEARGKRWAKANKPSLSEHAQVEWGKKNEEKKKRNRKREKKNFIAWSEHVWVYLFQGYPDNLIRSWLHARRYNGPSLSLSISISLSLTYSLYIELVVTLVHVTGSQLHTHIHRERVNDPCPVIIVNIRFFSHSMNLESLRYISLFD